MKLLGKLTAHAMALKWLDGSGIPQEVLSRDVKKTGSMLRVIITMQAELKVLSTLCCRFYYVSIEK